MVNKFYSAVADSKQPKNLLDLTILGEETFRMVGPGWISNSGESGGFESIYSPTTPSDYDDAFIKKLTSLTPPSVVSEFLSHHFEYFLSNYEEGEEFLYHLEYIILPKINEKSKSLYTELLKKWTKTQHAIMSSQHKQERELFLKKAYQEAYEYSSGQPMSARIEPVTLGEKLGFNKATTMRIVNELVQDGHVTSTLGMKMLFITRAGIKSIEEASSEKIASTPSNIINISNASHINLQQATVASHQTQNNIAHEKVGREELCTLVQELKLKLSEVPEHLSEHQADDYSTDLLQLEKQLTRPELDRGRIARLIESIGTNFYAIPAAITANWLTDPTAHLLKEGFKLLSQ